MIFRDQYEFDPESKVGKDLIDLELFLQAGEVFALTAQSMGAGDVALTVSWTEDI